MMRLFFVSIFLLAQACSPVLAEKKESVEVAANASEQGNERDLFDEPASAKTVKKRKVSNQKKPNRNVIVESQNPDRKPAALIQRDDYKVVEPVQKGTRPSSKYENYDREPVRMPHPNAPKGLKRITSDRDYIYSVETSPEKGSASFRFGFYSPTNLENPDEGISFDDVYGEDEKNIILFDFDKKYSQKWGKLNYQYGFGFFNANGEGRFANDSGNEAREKFNFIGFPLTVNVVYRAHYWSNQWFVPYAGGGAGIVAFAELRDDGESPKFGAGPIGQGFGGAALSISSLASGAANIILDKEYGINHMWLVAEFRALFPLGGNFDFSGNIINAGLLIEY